MTSPMTEEGAHKPRGRVYIAELATAVDRTQHTIRQWCRSQNGNVPILPRRLFPRRDSRGWRYWTPDQVDGIIEWMEREGIGPGKGLEHFKPTSAQTREMLDKLRQPRRNRRAERGEEPWHK